MRYQRLKKNVSGEETERKTWGKGERTRIGERGKGGLRTAKVMIKKRTLSTGQQVYDTDRTWILLVRAWKCDAVPRVRT
jgi:hypothetical protein